MEILQDMRILKKMKSDCGQLTTVTSATDALKLQAHLASCARLRHGFSKISNIRDYTVSDYELSSLPVLIHALEEPCESSSIMSR
jgi:hypothetical protein